MIKKIKILIKSIIILFNIANIKKYLNSIGIFFLLNPKKIVNGMSILENSNGFVFAFLSNAYISFVLRPKFAKNFKQRSTEKKRYDDVGIIIQGAIGTEEEIKFVRNTIQIYKKIFPKINIIISTWVDSKIKIKNTKYLKIIKNDYPRNNGNFNINYQIKTTSEAIKIFKSKGKKFILKTRSDCRILKPNTISFLKSLLDTFPTRNNSKRIFALNILTTKFRPYGLSDILLFGHIKEIDKYFAPEEEEQIFKKYKLKKIYNNTFVAAEILLCVRYLLNNGITLEWTNKHWWKILRDYFGIIDAESIDLFWYKHDWLYEKRFIRNYPYISSRCIEFNEWISLYNNLDLGWNRINYKETHFKKNNKIIKKTFY